MADPQARVHVLRRAAGILVVLGFLTVAVVFYRVAPALPRSAAAVPDAPITTSSPASQPTPSTPAPTPSPSLSPSSTPLMRSPSKRPTGLQIGPGTTRPGILLVARPTSEGDFDVTEMVMFTVPTDTLTLAPVDVVISGREFSDASPRASSVQVTSGDQPALVPNGRVTGRTAVPLPGPTQQVELRYALSGVTLRSTPAPAGRALAAIGPLTTGVPADFPVQIVVIGDEVRNLQCPHLRLSQQACAAGSPPRVRVDRVLPWRTAGVIVQLDLPRLQ